VKTIAALLLGAVWFLRQGVEQRSLRLPRWISGFLGLAFIWTSLAMFHGDAWGRSLQYLSLCASGVALFIIAYHIDRRLLRRALWGVLAVGSAAAMLVMLQYVIVTYHIAEFLERYLVEPRTQAHFASNISPLATGHFRPSGTMTHPNPMGLYFAFLIPLACAILSVRAQKLHRWFLMPMILVMFGALYVTNSRSAGMWCLIALLYLAVHRGYRRFVGSGLVCVALAGAVIVISPSWEAVQSDLMKKARMEHGLSGRPMVWKNTIDLAHQAPVLGVGPGNLTHDYVENFGFFLPNDANEQASQIWSLQMLGDQIMNNFHAHNIYLQLLGELGIPGPLLYLTALIAVLMYCERRAKTRRLGRLSHALLVATAANTVGLFLFGFFDSQLGFTIGSLNLLAAPLLAFGLSQGEPREIAHA
jgi:O-antigen ligase